MANSSKPKIAEVLQIPFQSNERVENEFRGREPQKYRSYRKAFQSLKKGTFILSEEVDTELDWVKKNR